MQNCSKRLLTLTLSFMAIVLIGCSKEMNSDSLEERSRISAEDETERTSSRIRDIINLKGKTTQVGALVDGWADCPGGDESYRVRHDWSVYDVPNTSLSAGMQRLREGLPEQGWKIGKDGPDKSRSKSPEILARHPKTGFYLEITLMLEEEHSSHTSLISVAVVSPCYREPAGKKD